MNEMQKEMRKMIKTYKKMLKKAKKNCKDINQVRSLQAKLNALMVESGVTFW